MAERDDSIGLRAVGEVEGGLLDDLVAATGAALSAHVSIDPALPEPTYAYGPGRGQYLATAIILRLAKGRPPGEARSLGVTARDLYVPELNFVFGLADPRERVAVISLARLLPEYYGQAPDPALFRERAVKEALHELGHTYGLAHCADPTCVMHFSNSIRDTDIKEARFCPGCERRGNR